MALIKKEYLKVVGSERDGKKYWDTIGELLTFESQNGGTFQKARIFAMPGVQVSVFDADRPGEGRGPQSTPRSAAPDADGIPF